MNQVAADVLAIQGVVITAHLVVVADPLEQLERFERGIGLIADQDGNVILDRQIQKRSPRRAKSRPIVWASR